MTDKNKIYVAGPMRGYEQFNFPAFAAATDYFRSLGWEVLNPAEKDDEVHGKEMATTNLTGSIEEAEKNFGFSLRDALAYDLSWICKNATHIYMLKGWEKSRGAMAEHATAVALDLEIMYEQG